MKSTLVLGVRRRIATVLVAVAGLVLVGGPGRAETGGDIRAGGYTHVDGIAIGGGVLTELSAGSSWHFNPNLEVLFFDGGNEINLSADFHYDFPRDGRMSPYLGIGPTLLTTSVDRGDSQAGLGINLIAGMSIRHATTRPFIQMKGIIGDEGELVLMGGLTFF